MIKRFRFGTAPVDAPPALRPLRTARNVVERGGEGFTVAWFADEAALAAFEAWEGADPAATVVAEEIVQRGGDWLRDRWASGGVRWKHVAIARRAAGLDPAAFSARWRGHAGRAPAKGAVSLVIPEAAKGLAYAQNHPLAGRDGAADAITEVWFDDAAGAEARDAWFRANFAPDDLFGAARFLTVREEVVTL